jgi:hypothetical protein
MTTSISSPVANEHVADLHRRATQRRRMRGTHRPSVADSANSAAALVLRFAGVADGPVLRDLAELDDAPVLDGEVLLALIDGEAVAALSLGDGRVLANPFVPTEATVALLRLRAGHISGRRPRRRWPAILRPRIA